MPAFVLHSRGFAVWTDLHMLLNVEHCLRYRVGCYFGVFRFFLVQAYGKMGEQATEKGGCINGQIDSNRWE